MESNQSLWNGIWASLCTTGQQGWTRGRVWVSSQSDLVSQFSEKGLLCGFLIVFSFLLFCPPVMNIDAIKMPFLQPAPNRQLLWSVNGVGAGLVPEDGPDPGSSHCYHRCSVLAVALADTDPTRTLLVTAAKGFHAEHHSFFPPWLKSNCLLAQIKLLKNISYSLCLRVTFPQNLALLSQPKAAESWMSRGITATSHCLCWFYVHVGEGG